MDWEHIVFSMIFSGLVGGILWTIMVDMVHKYGEDITLLESSLSANTNKEKSCSFISLFDPSDAIEYK
ncbi:hypothetical protein [Xenorhabdus thuongxuanensis]|uniref:Uncharacterized protein n=1 Tax=Xenorhabdus thuongxuanensis TaxID=1873484 RepID=A0A1Q5TTI0_9GAMM|nr:hypothetical protein [Xenorhabdus thuongxuanensis]OKP03537.1 hypothetical protein Xentx_02929 [Xenorhabdus thuongxuanensis]